jgi:hypothetical protein
MKGSRSEGAEHMDMVDVKKMTPSQRVLAMEALWESMCQEGDDIESPDWHEQILSARRSRISDGKTGFVTLEQLREQLGR